jgi:hypothetical protein
LSSVPALRRPSLFWPLLLIGLGALLLLQTLGLLPPSLWLALAQLWPVLLILLGLDWLAGTRSPRAAALVLGAGLVLVAASLTWAAVRASQLPSGGVETLIQIPQGATRLTARVDFQTGALRLGALGPSQHLLEGSAQDGPGESVRQDYSVSSGEGRLLLEQRANALLAPFLARRPATARWEVRLSQNLPLALEVNGGAGAVTLDLTGLQLTSLDFNSSTGQTLIVFPASQPAQAHVRTGLGPATINLPAGIAARIRVRSGQAQVSLPTGLSHTGGFYTTAGFDGARPFFDLELSAGIGSVTVK